MGSWNTTTTITAATSRRRTRSTTAGTSIALQKAPDHPQYDVIADVLPRAHKRGMKVICWYEDVFRKDVPGLDKAFEVDVHGQPQARVCYRNPNTLNFWLGLTEDYLLARSYDVDGLMFGSERQGPLNAALGASHGGGPGRARRRLAASVRTVSPRRKRRASTPSGRSRAIWRSRRGSPA